MLPTVVDQQRDKGEEEAQVVMGRWQAEGVDAEALDLHTHLQVRATEQLREASVGASHVEDEGVRIVLLQEGDQEIQQEGLSAAGFPQDRRVRQVAVMKVQKVRRLVSGFQGPPDTLDPDGIAPLALVQGEEEGVVGIVGVEDDTSSAG